MTDYKTKGKLLLLHDKDVKLPSKMSEHIAYKEPCDYPVMLRLFLAIDDYLLAVIGKYTPQLTGLIDSSNDACSKPGRQTAGI